MAKRLKIVDCECVTCKQFRMDARELWDGYQRIAKYFSEADKEEVRRMCEEHKGCDLCHRDGRRILHVPQIVKDFFRIEHLCVWCRNRLDWARRKLKWPICWGSTSDDEIKWFLLSDALDRFNEEVRKLSPAGVKKERAFQEWLASLPKYEEGPPEELDIKIKRRFRVKPRADITASFSGSEAT